MRKLLLTGLLLTFAMAISGCVNSGAAVRPPPVCPRLQPASPALMQPPTLEQKIRSELFETPAPAGSSGTAPKPTH